MVITTGLNAHIVTFVSKKLYENHFSWVITNITQQVYLHTLSVPGVWLFTLVSLVAALLPDVVIRQILLFSLHKSELKCLYTLIFIEAFMQGAEETLDYN